MNFDDPASRFGSVEIPRRNFDELRRPGQLQGEGVAKSIERALTAKRPKAQYVVGAAPKAQAALMGVTPSAIGDPILSKLTGVPKRA